MADPAPMKIVCGGCHTEFTPTGLGSHLRQTHNPACQAIYVAQRAYARQLHGANLPEAGHVYPRPHSPVPPLAFPEDELFDVPDSDDEDPLPGLEIDDSDEEDEPPAHWEPPTVQNPDEHMDAPENDPPAIPDEEAAGLPRQIPVEERFLAKPHITHFGGLAGAPNADNPWAPFTSQVDWEVAKWAKLRELLIAEQVPEALGLSYKNSRELNQIIDQLPAGRPTFTRQEIVVAGEAFDVYFRSVVDCIKALYGDPEFAGELIFKPERHYADADETIRLYHDMHTAEWWWRTQVRLIQFLWLHVAHSSPENCRERRPGATIVPVIISTDKTQTTMFRNKAAYPVYMTIGNITKDSRRKPSRQVYVLLGYIPTTRLDHITNKSARRRAVANLYHACMRQILHPLKSAGLDGIEMASGDVFAGDYPEQVLVTGTKTGECPTCPVPRDELGSFEDLYEPRDLSAVLDALKKADGNAADFTRACARAGIKPIYRPFWEDLPYCNIYISITSDVLHQLYQGVIKHIVAWVTEAFGAVEIDARCRRMPPNHNTRLFLKGITTLSRVSGTEHNQMSVRAALDFLYLAQYPMHSSETLTLLHDALALFHANKAIFIELGIRADFNFPKLHNIRHYPLSIKLFGSTDNYNTEYTERLHIDMAKDAYRATNRKDEYTQMTLWLERKEKVLRHEKFIFWLIENDYGATFFRDAFARYAVSFEQPNLTTRQTEVLARDFYTPFQKIAVYHKMKFWNGDPLGRESGLDILDTVHVKPGYQNKQGRQIGGRIDTVLVNDGTGEHTGVAGYRVGQVRVVFKLSRKITDTLFHGAHPPRHLAYVEWFSPFPPRPEANHLMYKISRPAETIASIIPIENIWRSIHLFPQFGPVVPRAWTSQNVLDMATKFYVSPWSDRHAYITTK
ncbi:hypothetical protein C8R45DRAFT_1055045 [Mycena sanguinolenta]|nr:hypothetical protein C8R45DRAFT_1055045 [Mycena sanguinolenta]